MKREDVINYYNELDRSLFIDNELKDVAHVDRPLSIGFGQTISQPSLVLKMTLQLEIDKECRVLEIGTGSGYQTALLAEFAGEVFTIERIGELSEKAEKRLSKLAYNNIRFRVGDGSKGWLECAPFDRIITTAGAQRMPMKLIEQLNCGGIAIMPVGPKMFQDLIKISKDKDGNLETVSLGNVRFVEMKGEYGWG